MSTLACRPSHGGALAHDSPRRNSISRALGNLCSYTQLASQSSLPQRLFRNTEQWPWDHEAGSCNTAGRSSNLKLKFKASTGFESDTVAVTDNSAPRSIQTRALTAQSRQTRITQNHEHLCAIASIVLSESLRASLALQC
jgi:hypothetical protein